MNNEDFQTEGISMSQFNIINGKRNSVSDSFLNNHVLKRENLYIKLNTMVSKIVIDEINNEATGVEINNSFTIKAN